MTEPWRDVVHRVQNQLTAGVEPPRGRPPAEPPVGEAEALRGDVWVEATAGRVSALRLDRRVLRLPPDELAAAIMEATNAALDDMWDVLSTSLPEPPALDRMAQTLTEISADSIRAMAQAAEGVRQSMAAVQRISELHRRGQ